ncbi:putative O-acetyltransferase SAR0937 [Symsagittifera roscoffensis]|uniref:putative O-acetyltransferase SAR0937 n=1 Tax=Symsagittifera roscoffensis TaxID=84072 RepID=UPI00307BDE72
MIPKLALNSSAIVKNFQHRPHLDVLRGLACIAVILFHCDLPEFSNGFLGVDVFFVLSGFLITSILLRSIQIDGQINFGNFYCRRFIRLFPASAFVLFTTAIFYRSVELPSYVSKHAKSFVASALYFENWHGLKVVMDYFHDKGSDQSPVVHFWSLSIEEQFYAFFPAILALITKLCRKRCAYILMIFILMLILSVIANVQLYNRSQLASYFSTFGRLYQLLTGSIAAIIVCWVEIRDLSNSEIKKRNSKSKQINFLFDYGSAFLLVITTVLLAKLNFNTLVLGMLATFSTFTLILTLEFSTNETLISKYFLQSSVLSRIGKYSYGMYLCHVPIAKIGDILRFLPSHGPYRAIVILFMTFMISAIVWHLVENPVKTHVSISEKNQSETLLVFIISTIVLAYFLHVFLGKNSVPALENSFGSINDQVIAPPKLTTCEKLAKFGSIFLAGDSYTQAWKSAFEKHRRSCKITYKYNAVVKGAALYLPISKQFDLRPKTFNDLSGFHSFINQYITQQRPNTTIFFTKHLHHAEMWYKNFERVSVADIATWKLLVRELYVDFISFVTKFTTPIFVIEHPHPENDDPRPCLKWLERKYGVGNFQNHSNECTIRIEYDVGVDYLHTLFSELKLKFKNFYFVDLGFVLFQTKSTNFKIPLIYNGVSTFGDPAHLGFDFVFQKFPDFIEELHRQMYSENGYSFNSTHLN